MRDDRRSAVLGLDRAECFENHGGTSRGMRRRAVVRACAAWIVIAALGGAGIVPASFASPSDGTATGSLASRIAKVLSSQKLEGVTVAVHVEDLETGRVLYSRKADRPLTPGSNVKILTTAAALDRLGPAYRFRTAVEADGPLRSGTLDGNLVLVAGGDPTLSEVFHGDALAPFRVLARSVRERGVRRVTGDLVVDASVFDDEWHHSTWPKNQLHLRYCAPTSGLALNQNCIRVDVKPGRGVGSRAIVSAYPVPATIGVVNDVETVAPAKRPQTVVDVQWREDPPRFVVRGRIPKNARAYRVEAPVRRPVRQAGDLFREVLHEEGVIVEGEVVSVAEDRNAATDVVRGETKSDTPGGGRESVATGSVSSRDLEIAVHESPLADAIRITNEQSQNFCAEQIFKTLGSAHAGVGSFDSGSGVVLDYLGALGCSLEGVEVEDGSGLSRANRVPARVFVRVLRAVMLESDPALAREFFLSLPVSGIRGSLDDRMTGKAYLGRVAAKTGYVSRASALSGFAEASSGRTRVFSILMNGFAPPRSNREMKDLQDRIVRAIVDET